MKRISLLLVALAYLATGCWDRWEIEDRGLLLAAGVDLAEHSPAGGTEARAYPLAGRKPSYRLTLQVLVPAQGEAGTGGANRGGRGNEGGAPLWNLSTTGASLATAVREAATRIYREPTFEQLQVIVLGEELARQGVARPLDFFLREREVRYRTRVFLAAGEALKVLEVKPVLQPVNGLYLARLAENTKTTSRIGPDMDLGDVERRLQTRRPLVLPRVVPAQGEVKLAGAGVLDRQGRLVGWLDELETQSLRFVLDRVKSASLPVLLDGEVVAFEVSGNRTEVSPLLRDGELVMRVFIQSEGSLTENQGPGDPLQKPFLEEVQDEVAGQLAGQVKATVERVQQELGMDIFDFGRAVEKRYPATWRAIEPDWDAIFPTLPVEVEAQVFIRRVGTVAGGGEEESPGGNGGG